MAGDEPKIGTAFIEIKARKAASFNDDARRAGQDAGKEYEKAFEREADKASAGSRGKHVAEGKKAGAEIGDAAGKEAGARTSKGVTDALAKSRTRRARDGKELGDALGGGAEKGFRTRFLAGVRTTSGRAGGILENSIYKGINKGFKRGLLGAVGIGALASSLGGLGSVTAGIVGAVSALSGAVGLLPAVLTSAGIAAGALKIGLFGIGDALKNSGDATAFAKSLEKLSPAAKSFTKALVDLKPQVRELRDAVQDGLFKGADKEVAALGERYLPLIKRGLTETTQAFGRGRRSVAEYLDTAKASGQVTGILENTSDSAGRLSVAFKPFVAAFLTIAGTGTKFLPDLSEGLANAAKRLEAFTGRTAKSGAMAEFFQGGIDAVGDLGSALKGAGRIIGGIFKAGGGANTSVLETFAKLLNRVGDQVGKPEFQAGLSSFFKAIGSAGDSVGGALPAVADALVALEPALSKIVSGSGEALASILESVAGAAVILAPVLDSVAGALAAIGPYAGHLLEVLVAVTAATKIYAAVQSVLNLVLLANPIGLIITAVALLAAGLVLAYKKSETFRAVINAVFRVVANTILDAISAIIGTFGGLFRVLGHLPGAAGRAFRSAAKAADIAKNKVDGLKAAINTLHGKEVRLLVKTEYRATFDSELSRDAAMANRGRAMTGGLVGDSGVVRRASGGFIDPRLGGPRQDNVPLLVSGGEYVVNAYAVSQPGVLSLLRAINTSNRLPKLANGGQVARRVSVGMNDLTASKPERIARMEAAARAPEPVFSGPARLHPDDIAALGFVFDRAIRQQRIVLDSGQIAGAVLREGGRF